jgi:hypothetical protein
MTSQLLFIYFASSVVFGDCLRLYRCSPTLLRRPRKAAGSPILSSLFPNVTTVSLNLYKAGGHMW